MQLNNQILKAERLNTRRISVWLVHSERTVCVVPLQCCREHEEFEKFFLCNDLLFQWLPCHSELHKEVEILQPGPPAQKQKKKIIRMYYIKCFID